MLLLLDLLVWIGLLLYSPILAIGTYLGILLLYTLPLMILNIFRGGNNSKQFPWYYELVAGLFLPFLIITGITHYLKFTIPYLYYKFKTRKINKDSELYKDVLAKNVVAICFGKNKIKAIEEVLNYKYAKSYNVYNIKELKPFLSNLDLTDVDLLLLEDFEFCTDSNIDDVEYFRKLPLVVKCNYYEYSYAFNREKRNHYKK